MIRFHDHEDDPGILALWDRGFNSKQIADRLDTREHIIARRIPLLLARRRMQLVPELVLRDA